MPVAAPAAPIASVAPLRVAIVGHVDHGKSTLIGRLLVDSGAVHESRLRQLEAVAKRRGARVEWANLMDAFQAERDQNITIDTAQVWFRAPLAGGGEREIRIIDAPGHREFLKNMVTGAAQADAAVLVVDAQEGIQQQTRRHAWLLRMLDVRQVVIAVNKVDLIGHDAARFRALEAALRDTCAGIGVAPLAILPVAAYAGENIVRRSPALAWWDGPTLCELLTGLVPAPPAPDLPLRVVVQDVYRFDERRIIAGRVESGTLKVGDQLLFSPGRKPGVVASLERWAGPRPDAVTAGESVAFTLTEQLFVERGHVASHVDRPPQVTGTLRATVFWMGEQPLAPDRPFKLKLATQEVEARLVSVERVLDAGELHPVARDVPRVERHEVGEVTLSLARPVAYDAGGTIPATGRFVLVDGTRIAGGGRIASEATAPPAGVKSRNITWTASRVTRAERDARHGHSGAVVWMTGLSASGKSTIARALERRCFDAGRQVIVLDGDNLRFGLNSDLGFAPEDRVENIRRVAEVARLVATAGQIVIVALISPIRRDRALARTLAADVGFVEVFVDCPVDECARRDPKGLYRRAKAGEIREFTGVSAPYEPPLEPEVHIRTDRQGVPEAVEAVEHALAEAWRALAERRE